MTPAELRALLTWRMVSDPWPACVDLAVIDEMLRRESVALGYADWVEAYHRLKA
jgi:hypothetical protein